MALSDFVENEAELAPLGEGDVRVKVEYLSFDPSQKGQLENIAGYSRGHGVGDVMPARGFMPPDANIYVAGHTGLVRRCGQGTDDARARR